MFRYFIVLLLSLKFSFANVESFINKLVSENKIEQAESFLLNLRVFGDIEAIYFLGIISLAKHDYNNANTYFSEAAALGCRKSIRSLAESYLSGCGYIQRNEIMAFHLYKKAADLGDGNAQFNVAVLYKNGQGVEVSIEMAKKYFLMASKNDELGNLRKDAMNYFNLLK